MTLRALSDLAPNGFGMMEIPNAGHSAQFRLYQRLPGFPPAMAEHPMAATTVPTRLLRTWTLDGTGWGRVDSGLTADFWTEAAGRLNIPRNPSPSSINGSDPEAPMLPVADWQDAHEISLARIMEIVLAYTDGATRPPFADVRRRIRA
ncbi:hypothetical protein CKO28_03095 [Rhodovibrio sodomensis]|uniref:Uncharacterized protein n=1 Tax=Rhodovibrio sodomensis TaxID=1088 RepID=A0ABS1D9K6_9PROT|nr:hypothetical protein [Rhodovibrio sodomensis]MBK1667030.1 hypothetical protein [Rhodovibrio sodomensis]